MLKSMLHPGRKNLRHGARLSACLRWLDSHVDRFGPWRNKQVNGDGMKAFAELAIVYA